ncbi:RraA family protein [Bacteroidota bacterium]
MKTLSYFLTLCFSLCLLQVYAQETDGITDEQILELYKDLRVADVADGLDMVGLRDLTIMDQKIEALWKDIDQFKHIFRGIAVTARYVPTNRVIPNPMGREEFKKWEGSWYGNISTEPFVEHIKKGTVLVLDVQGDGDTGSVGSNNGLGYIVKGAVGIVSNGGIRDTDEVIKQRIPVYLDYENRGRGIRPGRNEIESVNKPVTVGGVLVNPGDVIVADGDGVVVVPRAHAAMVADYAMEILGGDKNARRNLYKKLGMPLDHTVEE